MTRPFGVLIGKYLRDAEATTVGYLDDAEVTKQCLLDVKVTGRCLDDVTVSFHLSGTVQLDRCIVIFVLVSMAFDNNHFSCHITSNLNDRRILGYKCCGPDSNFSDNLGFRMSDTASLDSDIIHSICTHYCCSPADTPGSSSILLHTTTVLDSNYPSYCSSHSLRMGLHIDCIHLLCTEHRF